MNGTYSKLRSLAAFTLLELLVVVAIIGVLAALLLPVISSVQNNARNVQAKNDEHQIVNCVMTYTTEYGHTPIPPGYQGNDQYTYGEYLQQSSVLINVLRANIDGTHGETQATIALVKTMNPQMSSYMDWPVAKNKTNPKGGLGFNDGQPYDPWGRTYIVRIDANGDGMVPNPYLGKSAGGDPLPFQCISWSFGKDGQAGAIGIDKNTGVALDDVISWQ